jgi:hypothetical protein
MHPTMAVANMLMLLVVNAPCAGADSTWHGNGGHATAGDVGVTAISK